MMQPTRGPVEKTTERNRSERKWESNPQHLYYEVCALHYNSSPDFKAVMLMREGSQSIKMSKKKVSKATCLASKDNKGNKHIFSGFGFHNNYSLSLTSLKISM